MKNLKKVMFCSTLLFCTCIFTGCVGIVTGDLKSDKNQAEENKKPRIVTVNHYYYVIMLDKNDLQYNHKKHPGEAGNNYQPMPYESSHRKQRGRTAPNEAEKNILEKPVTPPLQSAK